MVRMDYNVEILKNARLSYVTCNSIEILSFLVKGGLY